MRDFYKETCKDDRSMNWRYCYNNIFIWSTVMDIKLFPLPLFTFTAS